jgi:dTDP-4-amino-4,6-dideoxygalactose transaminase
MLRIGPEEAAAVAQVIASRKLFRYSGLGECARFEKRYAEFLGVKHVTLTASGTAALTAALAGMGIGPGDEVIVPAHTYMATAVAVLAVGAIPVIVDVDESILLSPAALADAIGPCTKAVIPVHMWGHPCDMNEIMDIAGARKLKVIEDACQGGGGAFEGRMLGSIGDAGAFSFNFFKNLTCGEGGAVVTNDTRAAQIAHCMVDSCGFFWTGKENEVQPFSAVGTRASEIEGAIMNVQLDRIAGMLQTLRARKKRLRQGLEGLVQFNPVHDPAGECATRLFLLLPTAEKAAAFATHPACAILSKTGRHTFTEWDPILNHRAGHIRAMNPYLWPQNQKCRRDYPAGLCQRSLDILNRTVMVNNTLDRSDAEVDALMNELQAIAQALHL